MLALLRKELRGLRGWLALVLLVEVLSAVGMLLLVAPDQEPLWRSFREVFAQPGASALVVLFAFGMSQSVLTQEHTEGTLTFLDALPVHRSRVFLAKVVVLWGMLFSLFAVDGLCAALTNAMSVTSISTGLHLDVVAGSLALQAVFTASVLCAALGAAWLGRAGWMLIPVFALVFDQQHRFPLVRVLNPFELLEGNLHGDALVFPLQSVAVQLVWIGVGLGVNYAGFAALGVPGSSRVSLWLGRVPFRALAALAIAVGATLICASGTPSPSRSSATNDGPINWLISPPAAAVTERFVFLFPAGREEQVMPLIARADRVDLAVREFLDARAGEAIRVDLSGSRTRTHGTAGWNKIRLVSPASLGVSRSTAVLAHEVVHVYVARLADHRRVWPLFNEGAAEYVELAHFDEDPDALQQRLDHAALAWKRGRIDFESANNPALLGQRWDEDLKYPLGTALIASLVEDHGRAKIGEILRALGREDRPATLSSSEAWRDALQTVGLGTEQVAASWDALLSRRYERRAREWGELGTVVVDVAVRDEAVALVLAPGSPASRHSVCRFRESALTKPMDYVEWVRFEDGECVADRDEFGGSGFWYQVGVFVPEVRGTIWQEWQEASFSAGSSD